MKDTVAAVRQFNRNYTKWAGLLDEHLLASSFGLTEARILYELATRRAASASDLVAGLGIDPGYLSRILKGFAKSGYISRERSAKDGRQINLSLSKKGEAGLVAALEILVNTSGVANLIRQGKLDQLENAMQGGSRIGMRTMDSALKELLDQGRISGQAAYESSLEKRKFEDVKDLS